MRITFTSKNARLRLSNDLAFADGILVVTDPEEAVFVLEHHARFIRFNVADIELDKGEKIPDEVAEALGREANFSVDAGTGRRRDRQIKSQPSVVGNESPEAQGLETIEGQDEERAEAEAALEEGSEEEPSGEPDGEEDPQPEAETEEPSSEEEAEEAESITWAVDMREVTVRELDEALAEVSDADFIRTMMEADDRVSAEPKYEARLAELEGE